VSSKRLQEKRSSSREREKKGGGVRLVRNEKGKESDCGTGPVGYRQRPNVGMRGGAGVKSSIGEVLGTLRLNRWGQMGKVASLGTEHLMREGRRELLTIGEISAGGGLGASFKKKYEK